MMKTAKLATYSACLLLILISCQRDPIIEQVPTIQQMEPQVTITPQQMEVQADDENDQGSDTSTLDEPETEQPSPTEQLIVPTPRPISADEFVASPVVQFIQIDILSFEAKNQAITIWFNHQMDQESVEEAISITPRITYDLVWGSTNDHVRLNLTTPVAFSQDYQIHFHHLLYHLLTITNL